MMIQPVYVAYDPTLIAYTPPVVKTCKEDPS
jgi:hypothetical protein